MCQKVKMLAAKADDLCLFLRTHTVEGENCLLKVVLWSPHLFHGMHLPPHERNKYNNIFSLCCPWLALNSRDSPAAAF